MQNGYLGLWTEYEVLRRSLDFDMGTMEIDAAFEWVDPGEIDATIGARAAAREGVAENDRFCCGLNQAQMQVVDDYQEEVIVDDEEEDEDEVSYVDPPDASPKSDSPQESTRRIDSEPIQIDSPPEATFPDVDNVEPPSPDLELEVPSLDNSGFKLQPTKTAPFVQTEMVPTVQAVTPIVQAEVAPFAQTGMAPFSAKKPNSLQKVVTPNQSRVGYLAPFYYRGSTESRGTIRSAPPKLKAAPTVRDDFQPSPQDQPGSMLDRVFDSGFNPTAPAENPVQKEASILVR